MVCMRVQDPGAKLKFISLCIIVYLHVDGEQHRIFSCILYQLIIVYATIFLF